MLKIHTLSLGSYQTNTYIIHDRASKTCCVIDPGFEPEIILNKVASLGLTVEAILLTHGHFDHTGGVERIVKETGCQLWMHQSDYSQTAQAKWLYPLANCDFTDVHFYGDGEILRHAGLKIDVITTPGHTYGSVCLICENVMFSGDTLFAGSCGRTDLPGGSNDWMRWSLQRLEELEGDYAVYPGHGESTTLEREKKYNPYMG